MKRSHTYRMGAFLLAASFAALTACGTDFRENDAAGAGGPGGADAHTAAASGGGGLDTGPGGADAASTSSASSSVSSSTAGGGGGPAAPTTLLVVDQHDAPRAGIDVVVNDATGAILTTGITGASGDALVTVPEGGSVSVFYSVDLSFFVDSVLDAPAGGLVRFATQAKEAPPPPPPASTTYKIVAQGQPAGTASWKFQSTCDGASTTSSYAILSNAACPEGATEDFLVVALASDQTPLAWGALANQPTSPGALLDLVVSVTETSFVTVDAQVVNVPSIASYGWLLVRPNPADTIGVAVSTSTTAPFPTFEVSGSVPVGLNPSYDVIEYVSWSVGESTGEVMRRRIYDAVPAASTFDAAQLALVSALPADLSDPVHPAIGWTHGGGALGDSGLLTAYWSAGAANVSYRAQFAPEHLSPIRIPDIPVALSAYAPSAQTTFLACSVGYSDDETESSYDGVLDGVVPASGLGIVMSLSTAYEPGR